MRSRMGVGMLDALVAVALAAQRLKGEYALLGHVNRLSRSRR
jgi:hypothetical protein